MPLRHAINLSYVTRAKSQSTGPPLRHAWSCVSTSALYAPFVFFMSCSCVPHSTSRPSLSTPMRSARRAVARRCAWRRRTDRPTERTRGRCSRSHRPRRRSRSRARSTSSLRLRSRAVSSACPSRALARRRASSNPNRSRAATTAVGRSVGRRSRSVDARSKSRTPRKCAPKRRARARRHKS